MSDAPTLGLSQVAMLAPLALAKKLQPTNHASPMKSWSTPALDNFEDTKRLLFLLILSG
jgi:hypothetical protein